MGYFSFNDAFKLGIALFFFFFHAQGLQCELDDQISNIQLWEQMY